LICVHIVLEMRKQSQEQSEKQTSIRNRICPFEKTMTDVSHVVMQAGAITLPELERERGRRERGR
jgi:hypothetical protein